MTDSSNTSIINTVVIIGASGFIGQYLLNALALQLGVNILVLVRGARVADKSNVHFIEGDLLSLDSLDKLLVPNCVVFNLAYLSHNNIQATSNLAIACIKHKVRRLVHCSTAVVCGDVKDDVVTENTACFPVSEYQKTKLAIENILIDASVGKFELAILRPTAVFGSGGSNLVKLANDLLTKSSCVNYLKSSILNKRSMNLVSVENVVAALVFLMSSRLDGSEVYIISDDDSLDNNYIDVENRLLTKFNKSYLFPRFYFPKFILSSLMFMARRSITNPSIKFCDNKLVSLGFKKPKDFLAAVDAFADYYKSSFMK